MRTVVSIILTLFCMIPVLGQTIKTASGDISVLSGEKELSVTFGYENMQVQGYPSEAEFIKDKAQLREKHKPGSGKEFEESWFADRAAVYEPLFLEHLNDNIPEKRKITVSKGNANAKYNLHVQTLWVYPGYNVGFFQPAKIEVVLRLYEIGKPESVLWESKSPIRIIAKTAAYERELRIGAAYTALAKSMSWLLKKKAK